MDAMCKNIATEAEVDTGLYVIEPSLQTFDQDLRFILVDKVEGDAVTTKVNNTMEGGGIQALYKYEVSPKYHFSSKYQIFPKYQILAEV